MVNTRPALSRASLSALHWERNPTRTHPSTLRLCHEARRHSASATPDQTLFGLCRLSGRPRAERSAIKQNLCVHTTIAGIVKGKCHLNFIDIVRVIDFVFLVLGWLVQKKRGKIMFGIVRLMHLLFTLLFTNIPYWWLWKGHQNDIIKCNKRLSSPLCPCEHHWTWSIS